MRTIASTTIQRFASLASLWSLLVTAIPYSLSGAITPASEYLAQLSQQQRPLPKLTAKEEAALTKELSITRARGGQIPTIRLPDGTIVQPADEAELRRIKQLQKANTETITDADLAALKKGPLTDSAKTLLTTPPTLTQQILSATGTAAQKGAELVLEKKISITFPVLGGAEIQLVPDPYGKQMRLSVAFTRNGKNLLKFRPVILNDMQLEAQEGKLTGRLHKGNTTTVFGKPATFRIKELRLGEYGNLINEMVLDLEFEKPFRTTIPGLNTPLEFSRAYVTLSDISEYPVTLTTLVTIFGKETRLLILYSPANKVTLALQVQQLPLKSVIRAIGGTPLKDMQIAQGRIMVDLWVPSPGNTGDIHIPEEDPARQLRLEADLEKIPLPIAQDESLEDTAPEEMSSELTTEMTAELTAPPESAPVPFVTPASAQEPAQEELRRASPQSLPATPTTTSAPSSSPPADIMPPQSPADLAALAALSETAAAPATAIPELTEADFAVTEPDDLSNIPTPAEFNNPDLAHPGDTELDPALLQEATPIPDYIEEYTAADPQPACDIRDICCREPGTESYPYFSLQAMISRMGTYISISANDLTLPRIGVVQNASIMVNIDREAIRRDDLELRPELEKKSLKGLRAEMLMQLSCLPLKQIGYIEDGMISLELQTKEKEGSADVVYAVKRGKLRLIGTMRLNLPKLGKLPILVDAAITKKGLLFSGKLDFCEEWNAQRQTRTGALTEKSCKKNRMSYKGMTLESVRVTYGNLPLHAAEQEATYAATRERSDLREQARAQATAARNIRAAQLQGEEPAPEDIAATQKVIPSPESIARSKRKKALTLIATTNLWGIRFIVTLTAVPAAKAGERDLIFGAKGVVKNFKPFKYIPGMQQVKELRDITMNELSAEIQWSLNPKNRKPMPSLKLGGAMALFGTLFRAHCQWVVSKKGVPGLFIHTEPQRQQSLVDLIPPLAAAGGFFREITCCNSSLAIATVSEIDTSYLSADDMIALAPYRLDSIRKGVSLVANVPLTGTLGQVGTWLGIAKDTSSRNLCQEGRSQFRMLANINMEKPTLSEFRIALSKTKLRQLSSTTVRTSPVSPTTKTLYTQTDTRFSDASKNTFVSDVHRQGELYGMGATSLALPVPPQEPRKEPLIEFEGAELFILGDVVRPNYGVAAMINLRPTQKPEDLLKLKGSVEFGPTNVTLGAQMLGTWHNAFSLKGWELSNVALILGFVYGAFTPVRLGGAAQLNVKKDFAADFKFMADTDVTNMGFEGNISQVITLFDLIKFTLDALDVKLPGDISKLPMPLELYDTGIKYAPRDIRIGDQILEAGFGVKTNFKLLGKRGKIDMHVNGAGLKALGTIEQINLLDLLKITGAGGKGDPMVDIEASLARQNFLISGNINIANLVKAEAYMELSSSGFAFNFLESIGSTLYEGKPLLAVQVTGRTSGPISNPQFTIIFDFQKHFQEFIRQQVDSALKVAEKEVEQTLNKAQSEINKINGVIRDADAKIKAAEAEVNHARSALTTIRTERETARRKIAEAQSHVDSIKKEIQELDRWYNSLPNA